MDSSTRIGDLPDTHQSMSFMEPIKGRIENEPLQAPTYQTLDLHPNPYGIPKPSTPMDFSMPSSSAPPPQFLPNRDIPRPTLSHVQDEQIQPNYIPKPKLTTDFILENVGSDGFEADKWTNYRQQKYRQSKYDRLVEEIRIPVLVALLFFFFQSTMMQNSFYYYFSSFPLFSSEGVPNVTGLAVKSALFGGFYYIAIQFADYLVAP
jgi:hypothetical protein